MPPEGREDNLWNEVKPNGEALSLLSRLEPVFGGVSVWVWIGCGCECG